jgi:hypothetical protein
MILLGAFCFLLMVKPMYERVSKLFKPPQSMESYGFCELSDDEWEGVKPLLPPRSWVDRPGANDRLIKRHNSTSFQPCCWWCVKT